MKKILLKSDNVFYFFGVNDNVSFYDRKLFNIVKDYEGQNLSPIQIFGPYPLVRPKMKTLKVV